MSSVFVKVENIKSILQKHWKEEFALYEKYIAKEKHCEQIWLTVALMFARKTWLGRMCYKTKNDIRHKYMTFGFTSYPDKIRDLLRKYSWRYEDHHENFVLARNLLKVCYVAEKNNESNICLTEKKEIFFIEYLLKKAN